MSLLESHVRMMCNNEGFVLQEPLDESFRAAFEEVKARSTESGRTWLFGFHK